MENLNKKVAILKRILRSNEGPTVGEFRIIPEFSVPVQDTFDTLLMTNRARSSYCLVCEYFDDLHVFIFTDGV